MAIKVHIEVQDKDVRSCFDIVEYSDDSEPADAATLARLLKAARRKAEAVLSVDEDCDEQVDDRDNEDDAAGGVKVGTAYVEVRPRFCGFDSEGFDRAGERVIAGSGRLGHGISRAFRP